MDTTYCFSIYFLLAIFYDEFIINFLKKKGYSDGIFTIIDCFNFGDLSCNLLHGNEAKT